MKIQLFATFTGVDFRENVGVGRLVAYMKSKDYEVVTTYLDKLHTLDKVKHKIDLTCQVFGFSVYGDNIKLMTAIADYIKQTCEQTCIVWGSKYATVYYKDIFSDPVYKNIDYIILGDGEKALHDLIGCIEAGDDLKQWIQLAQNVASAEYIHNKSPAALDINELPFADREWIIENSGVAAYICDCHGCVGNCSFCTQRSYYKKWNGRSPESLVQEIVEIYEKSSIRHFIFTGGSFEDPGDLGKAKVRSFCDLLQALPVKFSFRCFLRADSFNDNMEDNELLAHMRRSGFTMAVVGIEAGNSDDLKIYNKRATVVENDSTLTLLKKHNIYTGGFGFIMFNPYSNLEKLQANYEFLVKHRASDIGKYLSVVVIDKETLIYNKTKDDGLIIESDEGFYPLGCRFRFADKEVSRLWSVIVEMLKTRQIRKYIYGVDDAASMVHMFCDFLEDSERYQQELSLLTENNARVLQDYFYHMFIKRDYDFCVNHIDDLIGELYVTDQALYKLKRSITKKMIITQTSQRQSK